MGTVATRVDPGSGTNEDLVWSGDRAAIVLDGATGLTERSVTDAVSDGRWYVERLADELSTRLRLHRDRSLDAIVAAAVDAVSAAYDDVVGDGRVAKHESPSAAGAICRWTGRALEYLVLGDCTVAVRTADGVAVRRGDGPRELDDAVVEELTAIREAEPGLTHDQRLDRVQPLLVEHRASKNEPSGYWTLGLDPSAVDHAKSGTFDLSELDRVLAFTDGFEPLCTLYDAFADWDAVVRYVEENGLDRALRILRAFEASDPQCERWPRLKPSDDVGIAHLEL